MWVKKNSFDEGSKVTGLHLFVSDTKKKMEEEGEFDNIAPQQRMMASRSIALEK